MNTNPRILIVDDEPDVVEILSYNLKKHHYTVYTASEGSEGIRQAHEHRPDLIILDIRMPGQNGIEACRVLKQDALLRDIPVLFLTADSDEYTTMRAAEAGGEHFVTKPIRPGIILGLVREILQSQKSES